MGRGERLYQSKPHVCIRVVERFVGVLFAEVLDFEGTVTDVADSSAGTVVAFQL